MFCFCCLHGEYHRRQWYQYLFSTGLWLGWCMSMWWVCFFSGVVQRLDLGGHAEETWHVGVLEISMSMFQVITGVLGIWLVQGHEVKSCTEQGPLGLAVDSDTWPFWDTYGPWRDRLPTPASDIILPRQSSLPAIHDFLYCSSALQVKVSWNWRPPDGVWPYLQNFVKVQLPLQIQRRTSTMKTFSRYRCLRMGDVVSATLSLAKASSAALFQANCLGRFFRRDLSGLLKEPWVNLL